MPGLSAALRHAGGHTERSRPGTWIQAPASYLTCLVIFSKLPLRHIYFLHIKLVSFPPFQEVSDTRNSCLPSPERSQASSSAGERAHIWVGFWSAESKGCERNALEKSIFIGLCSQPFCVGQLDIWTTHLPNETGVRPFPEEHQVLPWKLLKNKINPSNFEDLMGFMK